MNNFYEKEWEALEREANRRGANGEALVSSLRDYYTIFEDSLVEWLAKLYDPKVGGFYYSNSARDNDFVEYEGARYPLLPDIESTYQAFGLLRNTNVIESYDELSILREPVMNFINSCLDPDNGFFYHPQWPKWLTDSAESRRGRDLNWSHGLAEFLKFSFPYPTARERLAKMTETMEKKEENSSIPEYLRSEEAILRYLEALNWSTDAYYAGNLICAQTSVIKSAGLSDTVVAFLNSIQNKESGLWGDLGGYMAANAYLKISGIYTGLQRQIPNADKAAVSILECATTTDVAGAPTFQYNVFYSLNNILTSLSRFDTEENRIARAKINVDILNASPAAILATKEKTLKFKKPDGSFSYCFNRSSHLSQKMPVAIKDTNEGDVNATGLATGGTVRNIYQALDLIDLKVPLFSPNAKALFLDNLSLG